MGLNYMGQEKLGSHVETVAVRIGVGESAELSGTGILYTVQDKKRAVVITAGHVLYEKMTAEKIPLFLSVRTIDGPKEIKAKLISDWIREKRR